ncbi:hypothetical protein PCE1_002704 [Barthelona sp. PCE]
MKSSLASAEKNFVKQFGRMTFTYNDIKNSVSGSVFREYARAFQAGEPNLSDDALEAITNAVLEWSLKKGVTHFAHYFHPLNSTTAEKHDSFWSVHNGKLIREFSANEIIRGEPDASSLPSGGLRSTFEARGYTSWDITCPFFIKRSGNTNTLFIPSTFVSVNGESLDFKTPLVRSARAIDTSAMNFLSHFSGFGDVERVFSTCGAEQEYFLLDKSEVDKRIDLKLLNRALFGKKTERGQIFEDHYFSKLSDGISNFMSDMNRELWELGIPSKTQHAEVAVCQFEMAPHFVETTLACEQNQLIKETMCKVALRHNYFCSLHEKPFLSLNGSAAHINYSLCTDTGVNFLSKKNMPLFLATVACFLRTVHEYAGMLRATVSSPSNDLRLGANEAPPAIISVFLGEPLTSMLEMLDSDCPSKELERPIPEQISDRNRTSPFAFTGAKFEFRMCGSETPIANPCSVLNTAMAEAFDAFSEELNVVKAANRRAKDTDLILKLTNTWFKRYESIVFNGDNYTEEWHAEAEQRGLPNLRTTVDAYERYMDEKNVQLMSKYDVLSKAEMESRREIALDHYKKIVLLEKSVMESTLNQSIIPSAIRAQSFFANSIHSLEEIGITAELQKENLKVFVGHVNKLIEYKGELEDMDTNVDSFICMEKIRPFIGEIGELVSVIEGLAPSHCWELPTHTDILY